MNATAFWDVIGNYNTQSMVFQIGMLIFLVVGFAFSYTQKVNWAAKFVLGTANLFIAIAFFAWFGTEPIQIYFALPLFLLCGGLFLYECIRNKNDILLKPNKLQVFFLLLYLIYPLISILLGNTYPKMVTYIMPCPVISLSIAVYACYEKKNQLLLLLLTAWG